MGLPERRAENVLTCAICGYTDFIADEFYLVDAIKNHRRKYHGRRSVYDENAFKTITVLYEGVMNNGERPPDSTNPSIQFMKYIAWASALGGTNE